MLIDIHGHNLSAGKCAHWQFVVGKHSLGIHPWDLIRPFDEHLHDKKFQQLKDQLSATILAIGECGLDRKREGIVGIETQMRILKWHMDWALEVKRPLIIHCVKAQSDLLQMLKAKKYGGKILLHDYAGNLSIAEAFLSYDCYFSFGARLFKKNSRAAELLQYLPLEKIFFETDDQKVFTIESIYEKACALLKIDRKNLETQLEKNLLQFFSDLDNISTADLINNLGHA